MQISFLYPCICTCSDRTFATHFETWREEMEKAETGLRLFVKQEIADLGLNIAPALLFLSRLDRLHLSCFHVERRYFDLAQIFVNELKSLKDSYANFSFTVDTVLLTLLPVSICTKRSRHCRVAPVHTRAVLRGYDRIKHASTSRWMCSKRTKASSHIRICS